MPTAAFTAFNNRPDKEVIFLAEIEPKEEVSVWTASAESSAVYWADVPSFIGPTGLATYRTVTGVYVDGVALTEKATTDDVVTTPGTWHHAMGDSTETPVDSEVDAVMADIRENRLYVHLTDGASPVTGATVVYITFKIYFATTGLVFNDIYYEPRLTAQGLPSIEEELEDLFFGVIKKVGSGTIELTNDDGLFDTLSQQYAWKNSRVTLYYGGDNLSYSDYEAVGQYLIEDFTPAYDTVSVFVRDVQKKSLKLIPFTPMIKTHNQYDGTDADEDFPNMDANKDGSFMPIVYGELLNYTPVRIDGTGDTGSDNTYLIADYNVQSLYSIDAVYANGVQVDNAYLQKSATGCTFAITSGYTMSISNVTCDVRGQVPRGKAWETSEDYLKFGGEIIADIYTQLLGVPETDILSSSFTASDSDESAQQAVLIQQQQSARQYIKKIERGILGRTVRNLDGKLELSLWTPSTDLNSATLIEDPDVLSMEPDLRIESIFSRTVVRYAQDPTTGAWQTVIRADSRSKILHLDNEHQDRVVETFLKGASDAAALAERIRYVSRNPQVFVRILENGSRLICVKPGDRVLLTLSRAPSADGRWTQQVMEVLAVTRTFNPPRVELLLNNMSGAGPGIGTWQDNVWPVWLEATQSEKDGSGWWLNNSNFADADDAQSEDVSVWW